MIHRLNDHYGNIYINLGEPFSLREYLGEKLPTSEETLKPLDLQQLTTEQFKQVQDVANYAVSMQQESTAVTISNLISIVMMGSLVRNELMTLELVLDKIEWLIQILRSLGASVFENDVKDSVDRILVVHQSLIRLDSDNNLRLLSTPMMEVSPDVQRKMKGIYLFIIIFTTRYRIIFVAIVIILSTLIDTYILLSLSKWCNGYYWITDF